MDRGQKYGLGHLQKAALELEVPRHLVLGAQDEGWAGKGWGRILEGGLD